MKIFKLIRLLLSLPGLLAVFWIGGNFYFGNEPFESPFAHGGLIDDIQGTSAVESMVDDAKDSAKDTFQDGVSDMADKLKDIAE